MTCQVEAVARCWLAAQRPSRVAHGTGSCRPQRVCAHCRRAQRHYLVARALDRHALPLALAAGDTADCHRRECRGPADAGARSFRGAAPAGSVPRRADAERSASRSDHALRDAQEGTRRRRHRPHLQRGSRVGALRSDARSVRRLAALRQLEPAGCDAGGSAPCAARLGRRRRRLLARALRVGVLGAFAGVRAARRRALRAARRRGVRGRDRGAGPSDPQRAAGLPRVGRELRTRRAGRGSRGVAAA